LVTGFYKEVSRNAAGDTGKIFKATGLSVVLVFLLILGNRTWEIYPELIIPLSIIIIYSLLALVGLTASRYLIKMRFDAPA
ncbi:MAG: polysaccharide biosynthesis protein, partial [Robiginitalea sp.]